MHAVRCSKCLNLLKLSRQVTNAKMKCKMCGTIFVASSEEVPDETPVAEAPAGGAGPIPLGPAAPPPQPGAEGEQVEEIPPLVRKPSLLPLIVVISLSVLGIVVIIMSWHIRANPTLQIKNVAGDVVWEGKDKEAYERLQQEYGNTGKINGKVPKADRKKQSLLPCAPRLLCYASESLPCTWFGVPSA